MSGTTATGLLQCSVSWHYTTPCTALAIGDERGRTTRLRVPGAVIPRWRTSPSSRVGVSKASAFRFVLFMNCLFPVPDSQPTATELFQSPLYGSGTVFRSISHLLRHFLSSALAWSHTSSNSITRNYCCRAREVTLSFMDTLIALTYLLTSTSRAVDIIRNAVLYSRPLTWCKPYILAVLYVCHFTTGLTHYYKTTGFLNIYLRLV